MEEQASEYVNGEGVAALRERLTQLWREEGNRAAQAEVSRLFEEAGLNVMGHSVALKPLCAALG